MFESVRPGGGPGLDAPASTGRWRVLVVDGDRSFGDALAHDLARRACQVETARTRDEAVARVSAEPPDLVVLDLHLPPAGAALELLSLWSTGLPALVVILVSGVASLPVVVEVLKEGAPRLFTKPVTASTLLDELEARQKAQQPRMSPLVVTDHRDGWAKGVSMEPGSPDSTRRLMQVISNRDVMLRNCSAEKNALALQNDSLADRNDSLLDQNDALTLKNEALAAKNDDLAELGRFKDEVAAMIVHDLKSPLAVIVGNYDYVLDEFEGSADRREALQASRTAGQRMLRLLANLIDVSRLEAGRMNVCPSELVLLELLESVAQQRHVLASARHIELVVAPSSTITVTVDGDLVTRAVENILDNALRYTPIGGRIELELRAAGPDVEIRIGNSGDAIPVGVRRTLFEKHAQVTPELGHMNLGLGLYFCRLAVEVQGGVIWIEETARLPTVFGMRLPRVAAEPKRPPPSQGQGQGQGQGQEGRRDVTF